jgi:hypothetical protein
MGSIRHRQMPTQIAQSQLAQATCDATPFLTISTVRKKTESKSTFVVFIFTKVQAFKKKLYENTDHKIIIIKNARKSSLKGLNRQFSHKYRSIYYSCRTLTA